MKVRRVDFSFDEFLAGTAMLSDAELGLYWRACSLMYSHSGPIHVSELKRWSRAQNAGFQRALNRLVELGKLSMSSGDVLMQSRVRLELVRATSRVSSSRVNGALGGRPSNENKELGKPAGFAKKNRAFNKEQTTINKQPSLEGSGSPTGKGGRKKMKGVFEADIEVKQPPSATPERSSTPARWNPVSRAEPQQPSNAKSHLMQKVARWLPEDAVAGFWAAMMGPDAQSVLDQTAAAMHASGWEDRG